MNVSEITRPQVGTRELPLLTAIIVLAAVFVAGVFAWAFEEFWLSPASGRINVIPGSLLLGAVLILPSVYLWIKSEFNLFHPIVFPVWIYLFPAFALGGVLLSIGLSQPYFLIYLNDPNNDLNYALFLAGLGYISFSVGALLPVGRNLGISIQNRLPAWNWDALDVLTPAVVLLLIGYINTVVGFMYGVLGYQRLNEIGAYDGLVYLTTLFATEAVFMLWLIVFRLKRLALINVAIIGLLAITTVVKAAFAGNRGSLLSSFILVAAAFVLARRQVTRKHLLLGGAILFVLVIAGMIYGTTFRNLKESESQIGLGQYADYVAETFTAISNEDPLVTLGKSVESLAERIDGVSSLAVVVSNYETLRPYEEGYGLDDNIWKDTITVFIPRPLWPDKPLASDPRRYSELYFNFGESSFAITPMGDLLRNFGEIGGVLGMFFLGLLLRIIYRALVESQPFSIWRVTLYFMLLTGVSFESFFGSIVPYLIRIGAISIVGIIFIRIWLGRDRNSSAVQIS